jgi:hypothetical protein
MRAIAYASRTLTVTYQGKIAGVGVTDRMPLDMAENTLTEQFLSLPDATHLFLTELDMLLPDETIPQLLTLDKDVVSGLYFLRDGYGQPCLYRQMVGLPSNPFAKTPLTIFPQTEPFRLNGCAGVGCLLVKRAVFEKITPPWWSIQQGKHGSDMYFSTKVLEAGCEIWVDPRIRCGQVEYISWGFEHYRMRLQSDPDFAKSGGIIGSAEMVNGDA